jgi:hypothetical protein
VLVGQPFDIVKVVRRIILTNFNYNLLFAFQRMQTAPKGTYAGMMHCAGGILKNEGPLAFYKVCLFCHFLFANFELILLVIRELWRHCWELVFACPSSLVLWNMRSEYLQVRTLRQVEGARVVKHSLVNNSLCPVYLLVFQTELFLVLLNISVFVSHD